jgi:hypothetical protein
LPFIFVISWTATMIVTHSCTLFPSAAAYNCVVVEESSNVTTSSVSVAVGGCWEGYTEQHYAYILSIPMTIALAVSHS